MKIIQYIPNTLTIIRILLVIPILSYLFGNYQEKIISGILFLLGAVTDFLDGKIARRYHVETDFGDFLDPLADKLLIISLFIAFLQVDPTMFPYWMVWVISREFIVTTMRIGGLEQKKKVKTMFIGKLKATAQFITIFFIIVLLILRDYLVEKGIMLPVKGIIGLSFNQIWFNYFGDWAYFITYTPSFLLGISTILSLHSGIFYIIRNRKIFAAENKNEEEQE
jgi:cardiolipin synthase